MLGVSFIAGLLIVSAAFVAMGSGDAVAAKAGPSLMFVTLPTVFVDMGGMATLHRLLVLPAGAVRRADERHLARGDAASPSCTTAFSAPRAKALGIVIAFMVMRRRHHQRGLQRAVVHRAARGRFLDPRFRWTSSPTRCCMPIVALLTCVFVGWIVKPKAIIDEVQHLLEVLGRRSAWTIMIKYIAPGVGDGHSGRLRRGSVRLLFHVS